MVNPLKSLVSICFDRCSISARPPTAILSRPRLQMYKRRGQQPVFVAAGSRALVSRYVR